MVVERPVITGFDACHLPTLVRVTIQTDLVEHLWAVFSWKAPIKQSRRKRVRGEERDCGFFWWLDDPGVDEQYELGFTTTHTFVIPLPHLHPGIIWFLATTSPTLAAGSWQSPILMVDSAQFGDCILPLPTIWLRADGSTHPPTGGVAPVYWTTTLENLGGFFVPGDPPTYIHHSSSAEIRWRFDGTFSIPARSYVWLEGWHSVFGTFFFNAIANTTFTPGTFPIVREGQGIFGGPGSFFWQLAYPWRFQCPSLMPGATIRYRVV